MKCLKLDAQIGERFTGFEGGGALSESSMQKISLHISRGGIFNFSTAYGFHSLNLPCYQFSDIRGAPISMLSVVTLFFFQGI